MVKSNVLFTLLLSHALRTAWLSGQIEDTELYPVMKFTFRAQNISQEIF